MHSTLPFCDAMFNPSRLRRPSFPNSFEPSPPSSEKRGPRASLDPERSEKPENLTTLLLLLVFDYSEAAAEWTTYGNLTRIAWRFEKKERIYGNLRGGLLGSANSVFLLLHSFKHAQRGAWSPFSFRPVALRPNQVDGNGFSFSFHLLRFAFWGGQRKTLYTCAPASTSNQRTRSRKIPLVTLPNPLLPRNCP